VPSGGPSGGPFLRLSARFDSACEVKRLQWSGGPLLLTMSVRHGEGSDPRICLWETGANRCATLPQPVASGGVWTQYGSTVTPDHGTTALDLFVYADVFVPDTLTQDDYANIRVLEVPSLPQLDVLATPSTGTASSLLVVHHSAYSSMWQGPAGSEHVTVDGLLNGWIVTNGASTPPSYKADAIQTSMELSAVGVVTALGLVLSVLDWRVVSAVGRRLRLVNRRP